MLSLSHFAKLESAEKDVFMEKKEGFFHYVIIVRVTVAHRVAVG